MKKVFLHFYNALKCACLMTSFEDNESHGNDCIQSSLFYFSVVCVDNVFDEEEALNVFGAQFCSPKLI